MKWFSFHWWVPYQAFGEIGDRFAPSSHARFEHDAQPQSPDAMSLWPALQWVFHHQGLHCHESWIFPNQWSPVTHRLIFGEVMSFLLGKCFSSFSALFHILGRESASSYFWSLLTPKLKLSTGMKICKSTNPRCSTNFSDEFQSYIYIAKYKEALWLQLPCTVCLWSKRLNLSWDKSWHDHKRFKVLHTSTSLGIKGRLLHHNFSGCHAQSPACGLQHAVRFEVYQQGTLSTCGLFIS